MPWWLIVAILIISIPLVLFVLLFLYAAYMENKYFKDENTYKRGEKYETKEIYLRDMRERV